MGLQLRRGLAADRTSITPDAGEPIYTTDTKRLYIGDGSTAGGVIVSGQVDGSGTAGKVAAWSDTDTLTNLVADSYSNSLPFGQAVMWSKSVSTSSTTANQTLDSLPHSAYGGVEYKILVNCGTDNQMNTIMISHDGSTCYVTEYGATPPTKLADFTAVISGANIVLQTTPQQGATTSFKLIAHAFKV